MPEFRVPLGVKARDRVSGYEGIVESRTQYMTGCNRVALRKQGTTPDGKLFELNGFDEPFVEVLPGDAIQPVTPRGADDGGPMPLPPARG